MARKRVIPISQLLSEVQSIVNNPAYSEIEITEQFNNLLEQLPDNMSQVATSKNGSYVILEDDTDE